MRPVWAVKAIIVIVFTSILFRCVCGTNLTVGGASGWDLLSNMQDWSSSTTFNVGDDLVFTYTPVHDVVEVNKQGYDTCTITNAIATYNTGETVIHITQEGTRYFVCGRMGHCQQGLKLEVQVEAQSNNNNGTNDDQNQSGRGRTRPPPRRSPPPRRPSPPSPPNNPSPDIQIPDIQIPPPPPAEGPCHCSSAEDGHLVLPLITRVIIILAFSWSSLHLLVCT